jgi:hypothetical protein
MAWAVARGRPKRRMNAAGRRRGLRQALGPLRTLARKQHAAGQVDRRWRGYNLVFRR